MSSDPPVPGLHRRWASVRPDEPAEKVYLCAEVDPVLARLRELANQYDFAAKNWRKGQMTREKRGQEMCEQIASDLRQLLPAATRAPRVPEST